MIDTLVDTTAGHEPMSLLDSFSRYNQILMHLEDQENTSFMTEREIYCYKVMSCRLKYTATIYQWLVNKMFMEQSGETIEVYIVNMLVKSIKEEYHLEYLKQTL